MSDNPLEALVVAKKERFVGALATTPVNYDAFLAAAMADAIKQPKLMRAVREAPETVIECLAVAATSGLLPGSAHDQFYLIPRWDKDAKRFYCTFITGYKGLCKMAYRDTKVSTIEARLVFQGEKCEIDLGTNTVDHRYQWGNQVPRSWDTLVGGYLYVTLRGARRPIVIPMDKEPIETIRNTQLKIQKGTGPWKDNPLPMAQKTVIRHGLNSGMVPRTTELEQLLSAETDEEIKHIEPVVTTEKTGAAGLRQAIGIAQEDEEPREQGPGDALLAQLLEEDPFPEDKVICHRLTTAWVNQAGALGLDPEDIERRAGNLSGSGRDEIVAAINALAEEAGAT